MKTLLRSLVVCMGLLILWQSIVYCFQLPYYILPSPFLVWHTLLTQHVLLLTQCLPTLLETILGLCLGLLFGSLAGFTIAFYRPLGHWLLPILIISQAIPTFAIAPLFVIWFGYGLASKIAITLLMIFFPITSALYDGLSHTPPHLLALAHSMNASRWRTFYHIRLPAALPALASGIRIASVIAPIGAIVGEWVGSSQGLGYIMLNANARMQIDLMFAALFIIIALALTLYFTIDKLLHHLIWWK